MAGRENQIKDTVGENIRERRKELRKSQTDLAIDIGSDKAAISRIENGQLEITLSMLARIADRLETSVSVLTMETQEASNAELLIQFIQENADWINSLPAGKVDKTKKHMALALDLAG